MHENMDKKKKIELIFPDSGFESDEGYQSKGETTDKIVKGFAASIDDIIQWFKKYEVESIELWIKGGIETGGILRLIVSAKGEGGMKVILKPKAGD